MEERYKEDESLLTLDIVQEKNCGNNVRLYGITPFGKEMIQTVTEKE
jgi:predicted transcriptional regulator with HTH domain